MTRTNWIPDIDLHVVYSTHNSSVLKTRLALCYCLHDLHIVTCRIGNDQMWQTLSRDCYIVACVQNELVNKNIAFNGTIYRIFYPCTQRRGKKRDSVLRSLHVKEYELCTFLITGHTTFTFCLIIKSIVKIKNYIKIPKYQL
jgi:hypothetical protein